MSIESGIGDEALKRALAKRIDRNLIEKVIIIDRTGALRSFERSEMLAWVDQAKK